MTYTPAKINSAEYYESYAALSDEPGRWLGGGAERLGLAGQPIEPGGLRLVLEAKNPVDGKDLPLKAKDNSNRRKGFDLTFSAPKSVSVLAMLGKDEELTTKLWEAHNAAVEKTLKFIEQELAVSRRGYQGRDGVVHGKILIGAYNHATSREDDPQIHTHCVLPNILWSNDGKLSSVWGDPFWQGKGSREHIVRSISRMYQGTLEKEVSERTGLTWAKKQKGKDHREIAGVDTKVIREFSRSRRRIESKLKELGYGMDADGRIRQAVELDTRSKKSEKLASELADEWDGRLQKLGISGEVLVEKARRVAENTKTPRVWQPEDAINLLHGVGGSPTWTRRELIGAVAATKGCDIEEATLVASEIINTQDLVLQVTTYPENLKTDVLAPTPWRAERFGSRAFIEAEIAVISAGAEREIAGVDTSLTELAISGVGLDDEQAQMVKAITASGGMHCVLAGAGTGKTFALGGAKKAWDAAGKDVVGLTPSWRAAIEMQGSGITSHAIGAIREEELSSVIPLNGVAVVDEAGQMATRDLAKIVRVAVQNNSQVVLVGDHRQLTAVEAGGIFSLAVDRLGATRLTTNRRQADEKLLEAVEAIRGGFTATAVSKLEEHGGVVVCENLPAAITQLLDDWQEARYNGAETLILSSTRDGAAAANILAHRRLKASGELGAKEVILPATDAHNGLADREIAAGDTVKFLKKRDFKGGARVSNGSTGTVLAVDEKELLISLSPGQQVRVSTTWAQEHLDLGYASTIHSGQGRTVGTARAKRERETSHTRGEVFVMGGEVLNLEAAHVSISRATDRVRVYCAVEDTEEEVTKTLANRWGELGADTPAAIEAKASRRVLELAKEDWSTLEIQRKALEEKIEKLTPDPQSDEDLIDVQARLSEVTSALGIRRRIDITTEVVAADANENHWLRRTLGVIPADDAKAIEWYSAAGALMDATLSIQIARLQSNSTSVRASAEPEIITKEIEKIMQSDDWRRLNDLVDQDKFEALQTELLDDWDGEAKAITTPAAQRFLKALSAIDGNIDGVIDRAKTLVSSAVPEEPALAHSLRLALRHQLQQLDEPAPAEVVAAALPGVTNAALSALNEAHRRKLEIHGEEPAKEREENPPRPVTQVYATPQQLDLGVDGIAQFGQNEGGFQMGM